MSPPIAEKKQDAGLKTNNWLDVCIINDYFVYFFVMAKGAKRTDDNTAPNNV